MDKRELSYTVGGNANYYSHYGEQCSSQHFGKQNAPVKETVSYFYIHDACVYINVLNVHMMLVYINEF